MSDSHISQHVEQRSQIDIPDSQLQPSYWDDLSKIWLTKRALREGRRRNNKPKERSPPYRRVDRPLTRSLLTQRAKSQRSVSEILNNFSGHDLKQVKQFARQGGPDTSDLRGVMVARCPSATIMLIIHSSTQNLANLWDYPRCHLRTVYPP